MADRCGRYSADQQREAAPIDDRRQPGMKNTRGVSANDWSECTFQPDRLLEIYDRYLLLGNEAIHGKILRSERARPTDVNRLTIRIPS